MFYLWVGFNSRWGSIVSIFVFDWGSINIFMGWGCNQEWGSNGADTVVVIKLRLHLLYDKYVVFFFLTSFTFQLMISNSG